MRNKYFYISVVFIFLNLLILKINALEQTAELECLKKLHTKPYILESPDGNLRFIQIPENISKLTIDNNVYKYSGLYSTSDTSDPIWTIAEYFEGRTISNDGTFVVGSFGVENFNHGSGNVDGDGLKFYKSGKLIKKYGVQEFVNDLAVIRLTPTGSYYAWMKKSKFDPEKNLLYIETLDDNLYVFDITTGEKIWEHSNWRNYGATIVKLDGEQMNFDKLQACYGNSKDERYSFTGLVNESQESDKLGQKNTELTIPFDKIARVENASLHGGQVSNVFLHLHNGDSIQIDTSYYTLCGRPRGASKGRRIPLFMRDIISITDFYEIEIDEQKSDAYPESSKELLEYYSKKENMARKWNVLLDESRFSFEVSVGDYCE